MVVAKDATVKDGTDVHTRVSGVADHQAAADEDVLVITRDTVENFVRRRALPRDRPRAGGPRPGGTLQHRVPGQPAAIR